MVGNVNGSSSYGEFIYEKGNSPKIAPMMNNIDISSTIKKIYDVEMKIADPITDTIKINTSEVIPEIKNLENLFRDLKNKMEKMSNCMGIAQNRENVFANKIVTGIVNNSDLSTNNYVLITANRDAKDNNNFTLAIEQLASFDTKISSVSVASDSNSALNLSSTLTINSVDINITSDKTLNGIKDLINAKMAQTGVSADIIKKSDTEYFLTLKSMVLATPMTLSESGDSLLDSGALKLSSSQTNQDSLLAKITYNGLEGITRNTNTIKDIVYGCTLELKNADPTKTMDFKIDYDKDGAFIAIQEFVESYNKLYDEAYKNDNAENKNALDGSNLLRQIKGILSKIPSTTASGIASEDFYVLGRIGIDNNFVGKDASGKLQIDYSKLKSAVTTNFSSVIKLFGAFANVSSTNFTVYDIGSNLSNMIAGNNVSITYERGSDGKYFAILNYAPYDSVTQVVINDVQSHLIKAPDDSVFSGLIIEYRGYDLANSTSTNATAVFTQGIADKIYRIMKDDLDEENGIFKKELERIDDQNTNLNKKIEQIKQRASRRAEYINSYISAIYKAFNDSNSVTRILDAYHNSLKNS
jgi:flagellar capping protein FliD